MSQQPFSAAALRGAVDLSALKQPAAAATSDAAGSSALIQVGTEANLQEAVLASQSYPVILVMWSPRMQQAVDYVDSLKALTRRHAGAFALLTVDVDTNPGIVAALQVQAVPVTFALIAGQPVPLFEGVAPEDQLEQVLTQVLTLAQQNGITGRVPGAENDAQAGAEGAEGATEPEEPPLPPLHQKAFDAIEANDLDAAADAYREALAENPADQDAKLGLAQVGLMKRTADVDLNEARAAAANNPEDIDAQLLAADLDVLGGHVEDAFSRLIDTVRITADADRNRVREHLVELFDVVGAGDERVARARKALMSALF